MEISYLPVSWSQYQTLSQKLASAILAYNFSVKRIVAISRGGLTLGHLLSDLLRIPIATIAIQSYTDIQKQGKIVITEKLQTPITGEHVLLVDDVADSGKTLKRAISYLKEFNPKKITTVTMFYKPRSVVRPDVYCDETTKWILFPYETAEMIILISQNMERQGSKKAEIQKFLEKLGYTDKQIAFVRKNYLKKTI